MGNTGLHRTSGRAEVWARWWALGRHMLEGMSYYVFFASKITIVHLKVLGVGQSRTFCGVR